MPASDATLGSYRILGRLGTGATSLVYRAVRLEGGPELALKILAPDLTRDRQWLRRFQREALLLQHFRHVGTVALLDWGELEGRWFMALELVEGRSLQAWIGVRRPAGFLVRVGGQLTSTLAAAHAFGLVYRDLKAANIIVRSDGSLKLLDFGLARPFQPELSELPTTFHDLTASGVIIGTPRDMSPEQAAGGTVTVATDLFSLGLCLWELATGQHPFASPFPKEVLAGIRETPTPDLARRRADLPPELVALLSQLLEKEPALRPTASSAAAQFAGLAPGILRRDDAAQRNAHGAHSAVAAADDEDAGVDWGAVADGEREPAEEHPSPGQYPGLTPGSRRKPGLGNGGQARPEKRSRNAPRAAARSQVARRNGTGRGNRAGGPGWPSPVAWVPIRESGRLNISPQLRRGSPLHAGESRRFMHRIVGSARRDRTRSQRPAAMSDHISTLNGTRRFATGGEAMRDRPALVVAETN